MLTCSLLSGLVTSPGLRAPRPRQRLSVLASATTGSSELFPAPPTDVEFPQEVGTLDQAQRAASFGLQAGPIVASYLGTYSKLQFRERVLGECVTRSRSLDLCTIASPLLCPCSPGGRNSPPATRRPQVPERRCLLRRVGGRACKGLQGAHRGHPRPQGLLRERHRSPTRASSPFPVAPLLCGLLTVARSNPSLLAFSSRRSNSDN